MKKIIVYFVLLAILSTQLPISALADAVSGSIVFFDADNNSPIIEIGEHKNVSAEVEFTATETRTVSVLTVGYDKDGVMAGTPLLETVGTVTAGEKITHPTASFTATGIEEIKVFVWDLTNMQPVLIKSGLIESTFSESDTYDVKFIAVTGDDRDNPYVIAENMTVSVSKFFEAVSGLDINSKYFSVSSKNLDDSTAALEFTPDNTDWSKGLVKFSGSGLLELTAQDYSFCVPTSIYVKVVTPIERYNTVFENTDTYLHRVGNKNAVKLSSLFTTADWELPVSNTQVEIENIQGSADGTVTLNTDSWEDGTASFSGTGVVKVTISDDFSIPYSLLLEVVDAKNITTLQNATSSSVVLLNDVSGTFAVTNGNTFYGNGFTVQLPTSYINSTGDGFPGYITIGNTRDGSGGNGGNLDNVRIEGPVYPEPYIYRNDAIITDTSDPNYGNGNNVHYFRNSVAVYGGDCTISNSYISGSRTALCIKNANNVVVENTTLSGGAYANMQISSAVSATLHDLTTVQTGAIDSYGKGKTAHGLGVVVDSNIVELYIEGELNQHNWLCKEQWIEILPSGYSTYFPDFFTETKFSQYWHYLNDGTTPYVNMGLIYACNWDTGKIHDNRINTESVPYDTCNATIVNVNGGIYSKVNSFSDAITDFDLAEPDYTSTGFNPVAPTFSFDNTANNDADDENDAFDSYCTYTGGVLNVGIVNEDKTLDLSGVSILQSGIEMDYKAYFNGQEVSGDTVTVTAEGGTTQTLTFKASVNGLGYDAKGNPIDGTKEYTWEIPINVATLSYPAPEWNMGGVYKFDTSNCYYVYYATSQGYAEAVPIYEGIKVNYYDKNGTLVNLDLSGTTTLPTGSDNVNTNAFTYTLSDGSKLTMKYVSGWKGGTTHEFTTYKNKAYIYPQSLDNDNYVWAKRTNQNFNIKIQYTFTDPNGQATDAVTMNWYNAAASNGNVSTVQWKTFDSKNGKSACVTGDTLVTLADGTYKRIDEVTFSDMLMVWDFYKGEYVAVPAAIISNHGYDTNTVIKLIFDDSTEIKVINLHQFFDADANRFVNIDADSVSDYVGHNFVKRDGNAYKTVKLAGYEVSEEYIDAYGIVSSIHYNILVEDMFSADYPYELYNLMTYFECADDMVYDKDKMEQDIKTYGLYSYEEFADHMTLEQFDAMNIKYMKIPVGKGYYSYEGIIALIEQYLK